jgi:hypothetical protein
MRVVYGNSRNTHCRDIYIHIRVFIQNLAQLAEIAAQPREVFSFGIISSRPGILLCGPLRMSAISALK